jgi:predicted transposase YbfD/YdcC
MSLSSDFELLTTLRMVVDPRRQKSTAHPLVDILFTAICGAIAGCNTWVEIAAFAEERLEWLRRFVPLANGVPSHDTFGRVFALLDSGRFAACLLEWARRLETRSAGRVVAIDGKTLRNSFDDATGKKALHLVSAWSTGQRLVLGQIATEEKSNEITAIPQLLELLDLNGAVVTIDAMGCQQEIAEKIQHVGGDHILALKDNQPSMHRGAIDAFERALDADEPPAGMRRWRQTERRRGAEEVRDHVVLPVPKDFPATAAWGIRSLGMVCRRRIEPDGSETGQVRYYVSSLPPNVRTFANAVRSHWSIENQLHWALDVTFTEDQSRTRKGQAPETTALLRRVALSKLKQDTSYVGSLQVKRKAAGWSIAVLERILTGTPE